MLNVNELIGFGVGGVSIQDSRFVTFVHSVSSKPYTFTSTDIGTPDPTRVLVVAVQSYSASPNIDYVRVDGVNMTEVAVQRSGSDLTEVGLWAIPWPAGDTATITYSVAGAVNYGCAAVYALYGLQSATPYVTAGDGTEPIVLSSNVDAGSFGIAIDRQHQNTTPNTATWVGLSKNHEVTNMSGNTTTVSCASQLFNATESPRTINVTWTLATDGHRAGIFAAWK